jgi:hypothetical protein
MKMALEERVDHYVGRGFEREQAEVLVLMEESAIALFSVFPEHFVLFGGATLSFTTAHDCQKISTCSRGSTQC